MNDSYAVYALVVGSDNVLYAGGMFTTAGGTAANPIARWDGAQWHPLGNGVGGGDYQTVSALAVGLDESLYVGGYFTTAGGIAANYIARWDGSQWYSLGSGLNASVGELVVGLDGSLYAGGEFTTAGGVSANNIARWDGAHWHALGSGTGGTVDPDVLALAFGAVLCCDCTRPVRSVQQASRLRRSCEPARPMTWKATV